MNCSLLTKEKKTNFFYTNRQLLGTQNSVSDNIDSAISSVALRRRRGPEMPRSPAMKITEDSFTDGDDEILESLVKTATSTPRATPRERKRTRNADRKSCKCNTVSIPFQRCISNLFHIVLIFSMIPANFGWYL